MHSVVKYRLTRHNYTTSDDINFNFTKTGASWYCVTHTQHVASIYNIVFLSVYMQYVHGEKFVNIAISSD